MSGTSEKKYISKRVKVKTIPFELDDSIATYKRRSTGSSSEAKVLLYQRNEFLAVRNDEDGFFLCRALQHIYEATKRFNIQWLEQDAQDENAYDLAYTDMLDVECILTDVRLKKVDKDKYLLPLNQKQKVEKVLAKSVEGRESSDEDDQSDEEPPRKKAKLDDSAKKAKKGSSTKAKKSGKKAARGSVVKKGSLKKKTSSVVAAAKGIRKRVLRKTGSQGKVANGKSKLMRAGTKTGSKTRKQPGTGKTGLVKKGKGKGVLVPRPSVKVLETDPLLHSKERVPFVSSLAHSKLALRAVIQDDLKLLKELIEDRNHVAVLDIVHSEGYNVSPLDIALEHENMSAIGLLCKELFPKQKTQKQRVALPSSLLQNESVGRYNRLSLHGVPFIRKLNMSRGSKEGNNAFTKDVDKTDRGGGWDSYLTYALVHGVSKTVLDKFCALTNNPTGAKNHLHSLIYIAVTYGHRKLAAALIEDVTKSGLTNFNFLHWDVLAFENEELKGGIKEASVKKAPFDNQRVTPLHCAAINPNPKYLSKLLAILPDYNIADGSKRHLIHYAVACEGSGPLQLLLDRNVNCLDVDNLGMTPLILACLTGRLHNVELLLSHAKKASEAVKTPSKKSKEISDEEEEELPATMDKFGLCGINMAISRPNSPFFSYTALHLVAQEGRPEIAKVLLSYGADVNKELSASKNKLTPLMVAAAHGEMDVIRVLIKHGAKVSQKDKLKRTPMMLAAMNGHTHIVSLLLSLGCSPNDQDSSGNSALHYAAGYGWYFCVKILLEAGANPSAGNDWKTTPLAVAFLKGHIGLADVLLEQPAVDINFRLDGGMTLVHMACSSALEDGIVQQLEYLVVKKNADCTLVDDSNANALHHLAQNAISLEYVEENFVQSKQEIDRSVKMAEMLLQHECDASAKDANGMTPLMFAIQQGNQQLVKFLVENGAGVSNSMDKENRNALHFLSERCMSQPMAEILTLLHKTSGASGVLQEMAKQVNNSGMTPLISACLQYRLWDGVVKPSNVSVQPQDLDRYASNKNITEDSDAEADVSEDASDNDEEEEKNEDKDVNEQENNEEEAEDDGEEPEAGDKKDDADLEMEVDEADEKEKKDENDQNVSPPEKTLTKAEKTMLQWEAGRSYIQTLIEVCGGGTDIPLQKKLFKSTDPVPEKLEDQYFHKSVAGFSAVHFLVGVKNELSATSVGGSTTASSSCAGLSVLLKCLQSKSDAEQYDCFGRTPLLQAIAGKIEKAARKLIEYGVDVNCKSRDKETDGFATPLILVARHGLHNLIPLLLQHGATVNEKDANNMYTALHYVVKNPVAQCFKQVVESLVTNKASVTEADKHQKTALHLLMEYSRGVSDAVAVAGLLLSAGASIDACDRKGRTPLHLAVNANLGDVNSSTEMEQFLLDKGANQFARDWLQRLPLHYVFVKIGNHTNVSAMDPVELCSTLTSSTNKPSSMVNYGDQFGLTPLHVAARRGAGVCCLHLIKKGSNVNGRDFDGNTPLSLAVANKHESCTILLLQQNADISGNIVIVPSPPQPDANEAAENAGGKKDKKEKPQWKWKQLKRVERPLEIQTFSIFQGVVSQDWQGIIFLMLDLLEKFSLNLLSVVQAALLTRKYHLALSLIRKARGKNELMNRLECDQNLAHVLAKSSEATMEDNLLTTVAQLLFDKGVLFDLEDEYGCTPLHYACLQGNRPLVLFILGCCKKINLEKKDKLGRTSMAATFWKLGRHENLSLEIAKILRGRGATLDLLCSYPSQQVFMFGCKRELEEEDYLRSSASTPLISPLMLSIIHHNFILTRQLIELGASINFANLEGQTPLMLAVYENNVHLVRLLLDHSYVIPANDEDELPVASVLSDAQKKQRSRKAFALARQLQKLPSIQRAVVKDQATGKTSKMTFVNGLNMSSKTYQKTSSVNEKALDCHGRSALHYLVQPLPNGSYDNYHLLQQLVAIGAPLEQADKDGKTVMDYAMAQGLTKLATTVQYLLDRDKSSYVTPKFVSSSVSDGITWETPFPDFVHGSDKFIEKFEQELANEEGMTEIEYKAVPDRHLSEFATGQVLIDIDLNLPYDVLLTKIDVAAGQWGLYNFYKMQLVHQKGKDLYILFTRWGRIGDSGNFQQTPFPHLDDAVKEFRKIFRAKTSNDWQQVKSFEPKPRKYRLVPLEQRNFGRKAVDISIDLTSSLPSKLHAYVQDMIKEMTDMAMLAKSMDNLGIDRSLVPLGRIKKATLIKAKEILVKLKTLVKSVEKMRSQIAETDMAKYGAELEKIASLTNEYYHLLPKAGFEYERIPILDSKHQLECEWKNIEALMELEIAAKIIIGAQFSIKETNPLDYVYRCLRCQIRLMDENETEAQYLLRYVSATWNGKVEAIFRVSREGEEQRLASCGVDNHKLLFHGSSSSNLISILSKGLLISPPDAPGCGSAFGNGIYTADRFSKSHGYCFNYSLHSKVKYMLVCEVALGKSKDIYMYEYQEKLPSGFQSVHGVGQSQPDPQFNLTLPTGAVIPLGASKVHTKIGDQHIHLGESEYIVYKEDQVCLRYIIQFIS